VVGSNSILHTHLGHTLHCLSHFVIPILLLLGLGSEDLGFSINDKIPTDIGTMLEHCSTFSLDTHKLVSKELWLVWVIEVLLVASQTLRKKLGYLLYTLGFGVFANPIGSCPVSVQCTWNRMSELLQVIATGIHEQRLLGLVYQNSFTIRKQ
jgi:hypothetical protein